MIDSSKKQPCRVIRLLQISDSHLFQDPDEGCLLGMNTTNTFKRVLALVNENETTDGEATFDLVLATGDITQDGSIESYQRFDSNVKQFEKPIYYLPGNHDRYGVMSQIAPAEHVAPCVIKRAGWSIIMMNSTIPGKAPGRFEPEELEFLDEALEQTKGTHVAVCLHHHPLPVGSTWLDGVALQEPHLFLEVLDRFDHVRVVIHGHVHQESALERNGIAFYALPSTCIQFTPKSHEFSLDTVNPGYRWFEFFEDGSVTTAVHRIENFSFDPDRSITGY